MASRRASRGGPSSPTFGSFSPRNIWHHQSHNYWRTREQQKALARFKTPKVFLAGAAVVVLALLALVNVVLRRGGDGAALSNTDNAEKMEMMRQHTLAQCTADSPIQAFASSTCSKTCSKMKSKQPRPLTHRACLKGCEAGISSSWKMGCSLYQQQQQEQWQQGKQGHGKQGKRGHREADNTSASVDTCTSLSLAFCDAHCSEYATAYPKPAISNTCKRSCADVQESGCTKGALTMRETLSPPAHGSNDEL